MIELISSDSGKLSPELIVDEIVSSVPVVMVKDEWMAKMFGVGKQVRDRGNLLDGLLVMVVHIFTKKNG
jgi:hypothetical protein